MQSWWESPEAASTLVFLFIFIVPMVPAAFFFAFLKAEAIVQGPLQGFNMKFGGAFAAYFGTALLAAATHPLWKIQPMPQTREVWTVEGDVLDPEGNPVALLNDGDIKLDPPLLSRPQNGHFRVTVVEQPGLADYPTIYINHGEMQGATIKLDPSQMKTISTSQDQLHKYIQLKEIHLKRPRSYQPTERPMPLNLNTGDPR